MLAKRVADAADAWLSHVEDTEAFRRLVVARGEWKAYRAPMIDMESGEELLDALADARRRCHWVRVLQTSRPRCGARRGAPSKNSESEILPFPRQATAPWWRICSKPRR